MVSRRQHLLCKYLLLTYTHKWDDQLIMGYNANRHFYRRMLLFPEAKQMILDNKRPNTSYDSQENQETQTARTERLSSRQCETALISALLMYDRRLAMLQDESNRLVRGERPSQGPAGRFRGLLRGSQQLASDTAQRRHRGLNQANMYEVRSNHEILTYLCGPSSLDPP